MLVRQTDTLIVGASISGLACAASLQKQSIGDIILRSNNSGHALAQPLRSVAFAYKQKDFELAL